MKRLVSRPKRLSALLLGAGFSCPRQYVHACHAATTIHSRGQDNHDSQLPLEQHFLAETPLPPTPILTTPIPPPRPAPRRLFSLQTLSAACFVAEGEPEGLAPLCGRGGCIPPATQHGNYQRGPSERAECFPVQDGRVDGKEYEYDASRVFVLRGVDAVILSVECASGRKEGCRVYPGRRYWSYRRRGATSFRFGRDGIVEMDAQQGHLH